MAAMKFGIIIMTSKIAYLTIDDAPSVTMSEKVDYLLSKHIPAIWFCQGSLLEQRTNAAIRAIRKGFVLGNHAYNHPYFSDLELTQCYEQIQRTDDMIEAVYARAGVQRPAKYFRFPYGDKGGLKYSEVLEAYSEAGLERKEALQTYLRQLGYAPPPVEHITYRYYQVNGLREDVDWYWTYDVMEWSIYAAEHLYGVDSLEKVLARMDEDEPEGFRGLNDPSSAEIVLIHDHLETSSCFVSIIERLLEKGLSFI
ncbi:MAG: polysaccharide deacetylase family protein [Thermoflexales bacterium]|nr:polysaccharide deacetylase family protein [Thermoflexales bacterium]